jgi:hypothetical protein
MRRLQQQFFMLGPPDWLKMKNAAAPAVKREEGERIGEMTRRKREILGLRNERDFPHLVELALPPEGFRSVLIEMDAFHRERRTQSAAAGVGTRSSKSIFDSVSRRRHCGGVTQSLWGRVPDPGASRVARRGGGLEKRAVTELERKHLAETDRHIAECKAYIAKQRDLIERAMQQGRSTEVAEETLEAIEASLRALQRQRQRLLDRLKERE